MNIVYNFSWDVPNHFVDSTDFLEHISDITPNEASLIPSYIASSGQMNELSWLQTW